MIDIFGFQIQKDTKWNKGLTELELQEFENAMGFTFPEILRNYYRTMNGLNKVGISTFGDAKGETFSYSPKFYSYPNHVSLIKEKIDWIFSENSVRYNKLKQLGASRIFPIYGHRFMLLDVPVIQYYLCLVQI